MAALETSSTMAIHIHSGHQILTVVIQIYTIMAISRAAQMVTLHLVCKYNNTSFPPKNQSRFGYI